MSLQHIHSLAVGISATHQEDSRRHNSHVQKGRFACLLKASLQRLRRIATAPVDAGLRLDVLGKTPCTH